MLNICVLVSGGGTNLQALIDAQKNGKIKNGRIAAVIASKPDVFALTRAQKAGIPCSVVSRKSFADPSAYSAALLDALKQAETDLVVLAGFLSVLGEEVIAAYPMKIINIHPSLIPAFCGKGFYGLKVHEAVLARGVKITGATVHFVNEITDGGPIILQKAVNVLDADTPQSLQKRVMEQAEWVLLPQAVSAFCEGRLKVTDGHVSVKD